MNTMLSRSVVVATLWLGAAASVYAGGWTVITLNEFADYVLAGESLTLTFSVRQHGNNLVSGLTPVLQASSASGLAVVAVAAPTSKHGEYAATLRLSEAGYWKIRVDGGFNPDDRTRQHNSVTLPPLRVIRDASAAQDYSEADRGSRLMVTKGCVGCHRPGSDLDVTRKRLAANYLKTFLADPGVRTMDMPNLKLKESEISALISFINGFRSSTTGQASARPIDEAAAGCSVTTPSGVEGTYGSALLSVAGLWKDGTVVFKPGGPGFVTRDGALGMKFGWMRGTPGRLTVTGRRLDGVAAPLRLDASDGYGDIGFQASHLIFPTPGCWAVTAQVGENEDSRITFLTKVVKIDEGPSWIKGEQSLSSK